MSGESAASAAWGSGRASGDSPLWYELPPSLICASIASRDFLHTMHSFLPDSLADGVEEEVVA